jgi:hypothetical protein
MRDRDLSLINTAKGVGEVGAFDLRRVFGFLYKTGRIL